MVGNHTEAGLIGMVIGFASDPVKKPVWQACSKPASLLGSAKIGSDPNRNKPASLLGSEHSGLIRLRTRTPQGPGSCRVPEPARGHQTGFPAGPGRGGQRKQPASPPGRHRRAPGTTRVLAGHRSRNPNRRALPGRLVNPGGHQTWKPVSQPAEPEPEP